MIFELAAQTRFKVLADLADTGKLAFGYHMPWPGFGRVVRKEKGFAWIPGFFPVFTVTDQL
ncbi:hypothetical protein CK934_25480 [Chitinophaga sp. MD30]|nr:hypothetical protein CK934_25480 [Chitinophaga sp. MD30]